MPFEPIDYLPYDFANRRHIGPSPAEMEQMLKVVGADSLDDLADQVVPPAIRFKEALELPEPLSEGQLLVEGVAVGRAWLHDAKIEITRLLADEDELRFGPPVAEHCLARRPVQVAVHNLRTPGTSRLVGPELTAPRDWVRSPGRRRS